MEDFDSTMSMLGYLGPMMAGVGIIVVSLMLWIPLILYVLARWRANREGSGDPQLGLKFALHYFAALACQLGLAGIAIFLSTLVSAGSSDGKGDAYRGAFGMMLPAGLVLIGYLVLRPRTNDSQYPAVHRLYNGFQLMVTAAAAFVLLVVGCQMLLAKGDSHGSGRIVATFFLVYGAAASVFAVLGSQLAGAGSGSGSAGGHDRSADYAPRVVTPPAPSAAQGGLPPLGGGAFPPIEPPR